MLKLYKIQIMNKSETGKIGEDLACEYLVNSRYKVLKRNYRKPWGEIDIIARAKDNVLAFVEVKALKENSTSGLNPEDHLTASKLKKLQKTCAQFVAGNPDLIVGNKGWRIDLITIDIPVGGEINLKSCKIRYYENI